MLSGDPHDQLAIAYHLIVDNKRIADETAKAELRGNWASRTCDSRLMYCLEFFSLDFYIAGSPPPAAFSPGDMSPTPFMKPHPERIARIYFILYSTLSVDLILLFD